MKPQHIVPEKVIGYSLDQFIYESELTVRNAIWYAVSLGFGKDQMNKDDLKYVYESHPDYSIFPTICTSFFETKDLYLALVECPGMPSFQPTQLVHGEHNLEILSPIVPGRKIITKTGIVDITDKGKGAYVIYEINTIQIDEDNKEVPVCKQLLGYYIKGLGGFGYKGTTQFGTPTVPERKHDKETVYKTPANLSIIFRLNGDFNPHNVDPDFSYPYDRPILHGLATYGICAKVCMDNHFPNQEHKIKHVQARFTSYIYPGETLEFKTW